VADRGSGVPFGRLQAGTASRGGFEANCEFMRFDPASHVPLLAVARLDELVDITGVGLTP
jgi:hypothetical protein